MSFIMENLKKSILLFSWIFMATAMGAAESRTTIPVNVGVVVDLNEPSGKMYLSCIEMALSDFYASHAHYKTRLVLNTRNSNGDVVGAAAAALDLIKNAQVKAILGPMSSMQASFVVNLGEQANVPIITFSATSPSLTSLQSSYFFRFAQNDLNQVKAISGIVQHFGWRRVVPIYVDNMYGEGVIPFLVDALQEVSVQIPHRSAIHELATDGEIEKELSKLMTMQTRVFIVHMKPDLSSRQFTKAKEMGMMKEGFVWITTNGIGNKIESMASVLDSMQGLLGVESYIPRTPKLRQFISRWKRQFEQDNPEEIDVQFDTFGLRAYDAVLAVAMAFEKVADVSFKFQKRVNAPSINATDLDTFEVSRYGSKLSHALSTIHFEGMAGHFNLVDRELNVSTFKIINVNDDGPRTVGYWTPENGRVVKRLSSRSSRISTSKTDLRPIIWPGESLSVPKGWDIAANGTKLRIGVPVKDGFLEFVKVTENQDTNTVDVTGFSIDVFKAVLEILPYALPYEFIPFPRANGSSAGSYYNDLVYQVHTGNFDAVVGDATITANRSLYVGFTMPYTESGVVMVVPIQDKRTRSAWVFLKPLTWDLWMTTLCFFFFIGFVIWVLEHRINDDFRGSPSRQVGTGFWFSFLMVFSPGENVVSNLSRFVMIIWIFVVLIVTQSYTASLTSLLTIQQLQPIVTDINDLLKNSEKVGYMASSYIYGILKRKGFQDYRLKGYETMEEIDEALSKGSANGGVAAIFHETPYMKLFVAKHCSKYTMIGPLFRTDGFAFVFPKGSPLIPDVSQAILTLTEGEQIINMEDEWIHKENNCKDPNTDKLYSRSLGLESFWILFFIAGVASVLALLIFATLFLYKHRQVLMSPDSRASKWKRIRTMFKIFKEKEVGSNTSKRSRHDEARIAGALDHEFEVNASPNNNWPESPLSYTNQTDATSVFYGEQDASSQGQASPEIVPTVELAFTNPEMHATPETAQERV